MTNNCSLCLILACLRLHSQSPVRRIVLVFFPPLLSQSDKLVWSFVWRCDKEKTTYLTLTRLPNRWHILNCLEVVSCAWFFFFFFFCFIHFIDSLLHPNARFVFYRFKRQADGVFFFFFSSQTQCTPTRGTTVITAPPVKAPRWPPLIQTTGKVQSSFEEFFAAIFSLTLHVTLVV